MQARIGKTVCTVPRTPTRTASCDTWAMERAAVLGAMGLVYGGAFAGCRGLRGPQRADTAVDCCNEEESNQPSGCVCRPVIC